MDHCNVKSSNVSIAGGAIYNLVGSQLTLNDCGLELNQVRDNASAGGGAIYNAGGTVVLNGTTISDNSASYSGGGIYNAIGGTVALKNSIVRYNQARGQRAFWRRHL